MTNTPDRLPKRKPKESASPLLGIGYLITSSCFLLSLASLLHGIPLSTNPAWYDGRPGFDLDIRLIPYGSKLRIVFTNYSNVLPTPCQTEWGYFDKNYMAQLDQMYFELSPKGYNHEYTHETLIAVPCEAD